MPVDHIRYDLLVREALRSVVRRVVADVAKNGLPGDHHFYIAFETRAPGVRISPRLRAQYPEEMTIVLQHQFWDLAVTEVGIEVGLSFGGVPEKLFVPFEAIKGFFDPSVQFGLEFEAAAEGGETPAATPTDDSAPSAAPPVAVAPAAKPEGGRLAGNSDEKPSAARKRPNKAEEAPGPSSEPAEPQTESGAEVVRLDRFRKK
jgi:uncharacterized protein